MNNIPDILKIGGHTINVEYRELQDDNAQFDWETNTITISSKLPLDQQQSAFLHECFHVMVTSWGDGDFGHIFLDSLSEQLYQLLKDNDIYFYK